MKVPSKKLIYLFLVLMISSGVLVPSAVMASNTEQQVQFSTPTLIANTSFVNVRTGPGVQYTVLITIVGGTQLPVLGVANDGVWYQVSTVMGVGWVNVEHFIPRGSFSNVPQVNFDFASAVAAATGGATSIDLGQGGGGPAFGGGNTTTPSGNVVGGSFNAGKDSNGNEIIISGPNERVRIALNIPAVDLRSGAGEEYPSIGTLYHSGSSDYALAGAAKDKNGIEWFAIVTPVGTGWVDAGKISFRLSGAFRTVMVINADTIQLGDAPGSGSVVLPIVSHGTEAFLVDISKDGQYIKVELQGGEAGWIPFGSATQRTSSPTDGLGLTAANVPAATGSAVTGDGATAPGQPVVPSLEVPRVIINTAYLNVRTGPGPQFASIGTISGGTELPVAAVTTDGLWYMIQSAYGQGWINRDFVIFRGIYANIPTVSYEAASNAATLSVPIAIISHSATLYAAPGVNFGSVGSVAGPLELAIVARTADSQWVQVNSAIGFGWVPADQVIIRGDVSRIPVAG